MGSKEGEPIDYTNLMTPEQIETMGTVGDFLNENVGRPATPYPGQLSAPPDVAQLAAMNTMMGVGGYGGYQGPGLPGYEVTGEIGAGGKVLGGKVQPIPSPKTGEIKEGGELFGKRQPTPAPKTGEIREGGELGGKTQVPYPGDIPIAIPNEPIIPMPNPIMGISPYNPQPLPWQLR